MAATSVTGTGIGESFGKQKRENNASCGAGDDPEEVTKKVIKNGCVISYKIGGNGSYKVGRSNSIRVC